MSTMGQLAIAIAGRDADILRQLARLLGAKSMRKIGLGRLFTMAAEKAFPEEFAQATKDVEERDGPPPEDDPSEVARRLRRELFPRGKPKGYRDPELED